MDDGEPKLRMSDYPLLVHYGALGKPITRDQAAELDFESRFNSIGQYVVGQSIKFWTLRLSREGKVAYDPEDILLEIRLELQERNTKYDKAKGTYLTFARRIIRNRLSELLESTRCVTLPANSKKKHSELLDLEKGGTITEVQRARFVALINANADHSELSSGDWAANDYGPSPVEAAIESERLHKITETLCDFIADQLTVRESMAIGYSYGLWGRKQKRLSEADEEQQLPPGTLRRSLTSAKKKLRELCCTLGQ